MNNVVALLYLVTVDDAKVASNKLVTGAIDAAAAAVVVGSDMISLLLLRDETVPFFRTRIP
jgi:hypothetical protein